MELINVTNKEVKKLSDNLANLKKYGTTREVLKDILVSFIPNQEEQIIKYNLVDTNYPICFNASDETIYVSEEKLNTLILNSIKYIKNIFPNINNEDLFNYYVIFSIIHETRHAKQYLIANGKLNSYRIIKEVYNDMFKLGNLNINKIKNFISEIIYCLNNERLVMERNANIEASELIIKLAEHENKEEMANIFKQIHTKNITYGYDDKYNGSIEETYKRLCLTTLYKQLPKDDQISINDRILFGLPIDEEVKVKILENHY